MLQNSEPHSESQKVIDLSRAEVKRHGPRLGLFYATWILAATLGLSFFYFFVQLLLGKIILFFKGSLSILLVGGLLFSLLFLWDLRGEKSS